MNHPAWKSFNLRFGSHDGLDAAALKRLEELADAWREWQLAWHAALQFAAGTPAATDNWAGAHDGTPLVCAQRGQG